MYHLNPAVIKSILSSMPDEDLLRHIRYIRKQIDTLPDGNRSMMFFHLYRFAVLYCLDARPRIHLF